MLMDLFNSNTLTDVTLVCEDGKQFKAHKAIICMNSPALKGALMDTKQTDPILIITGIQSRIMMIILKLFYSGEAEVKKCEEESLHENIGFLGIQKALLVKNGFKDEEYFNDKNDLNSQNLPDSMMKTEFVNVNDSGFDESKKMPRLHLQVDSPSKFLSCQQCNYISTTKQNLRIHVQNIHEKIKYNCKQCDKAFTQASGLNTHKKRVHEGRKLKCDKCSYECVAYHNLKNHKQSKHDGVRYKCNFCSEYLSSKDTLVGHTWAKHKVNQRKGNRLLD